MDIENRLVIAFALCALMGVIVSVVVVRYLNNRRQFKIRQSGRGKGLGSDIEDSVPAE